MRLWKYFLIFLFLSSCTSNQDPKFIAKNQLIIDTHIDTPYRLYNQLQENGSYEDISQITTFDFDYIKALEGGLNVSFFSIYLPAQTQVDGSSFQLANELIDMVKTIVYNNSEHFFLLNNSVYLANLPGQNLIGIALGMENGAPIEGNLERVKYFFDKGIRYITLTHSKSNHISDSSYDENRQWGGLSAFGKKLISEMNNIGMIIDISHVSDEAFMQVLDISKAPVIASHSSLRYFTPGWERNVSDEMLIALANNGGVLQINFGSKFINYAEQNDDDYNFATVSQTVDHFDRAISLVGIDHVGIGSDFDGVGDTLPIGLKDASSYPNLIEEFLKRGYSQSDIQKILGGNTLRVWREVENYARKNTSD